MVISPTASLGAAICRICHCGETSITSRGAKGGGEPLISPCHCRGTMGLYHRSCVERWLLVSGKSDCEICSFKFQIKRKNHSIWKLFKADWCYFVMITILHVILHTVLNPLAICLSYICARAGFDYAKDAGRDAKAFFGLLSPRIRFSDTNCLIRHILIAFASYVHQDTVVRVVDQLSPDESLHFNPNLTSLPMRWINRLKSFGHDRTRRGRRGGADVSAIYIPQQVMEDVEKMAGSGGENRGRFTVTPVNAAAGPYMELQSNLHAEISPIAVCSQPAPSSSSAVPRPLVSERSFGRDRTRRGRRGGADVSVIYIPQQLMEDVERAAGSGGENRSAGTRIHVAENVVRSAGSNRGRFTVTSVSAAAGHNMEFQSNLHGEISPIAVCSQPAPSSSSAVPRPLVSERSFGRDRTRRGRRGGADVSVIYIPQQLMEDVEKMAGSGGENRGRFTVTPVNAAAGPYMELQSNLHAEISPIAVCSQPAPSSSSAVPRPLVPGRHPSPPSTGSSFSCSPVLESGPNNGRSSANCPARCPLSTATLPRRAMAEPTLTPNCVTAASGSPHPLLLALRLLARLPPPSRASPQEDSTAVHELTVCGLTSTPSSNRADSSASESNAAATSPDRLKTPSLMEEISL